MQLRGFQGVIQRICSFRLLASNAISNPEAILAEWQEFIWHMRCQPILLWLAMRHALQMKQLKRIGVLTLASLVSISSFTQSDVQAFLLTACALMALVTGLAAALVLRSSKSPDIPQSWLRAAPLLSAILFLASGSIFAYGQEVFDGNQTGYPVF